MSSALQQLTIANTALTLQRLPKSRTLQAWDAADEYLLKLLAEQTVIKPLIVINDNFGALALAPFAPVLLSWNDSFMSQQATLANACANQLEPPKLLGCDQSLNSCLTAYKAPLLILMRVPKSLVFLEWQLLEIAAFAPEGSQIWLAGMDKHLSKTQFDVVAQIMTNARFLPGVKKARIWQAEVPVRTAKPVIPPMLQTGFDFSWENSDSVTAFALQRTANVFSGSKADLGAQFFIQQFRQLPPAASSQTPKVADLGCGNGLLSLCYGTLYPDTEIIAIDESFQAIACAKENILQAGMQEKIIPKCTNALTDYPENFFDTILCNPPFHQQMTVGTELAYAMLKTAHFTLRSGGKLYLVGNRHLQHHQTLRKLFGNCTTIASNNKFVVLSAKKAS